MNRNTPKPVVLTYTFSVFLVFVSEKIVYQKYSKICESYNFGHIFNSIFKIMGPPILNPNFERESLVRSGGSLYFWNQHTSNPLCTFSYFLPEVNTFHLSVPLSCGTQGPNMTSCGFSWGISSKVTFCCFKRIGAREQIWIVRDYSRDF